jgi:hypothetical protein
MSDQTGQMVQPDSTPVEGLIDESMAVSSIQTGQMVEPDPLPVEPKIGESTAVSFFGVTLGDTSVATAQSAGGIRRISLVDYESYGILGLYSRTVTRVYGE